MGERALFAFRGMLGLVSATPVGDSGEAQSEQPVLYAAIVSGAGWDL